MTVTTQNDVRAAGVHEASTNAEVRVTVTAFVNPWGPHEVLEKTYGSPRRSGYGARRAVKKYANVLKRLAQ